MISGDDPASIPIAWLSKADLLQFRPDLQTAIEKLSEQELDRLARQVGDGLQPFYAVAIMETLRHQFGDEPPE